MAIVWVISMHSACSEKVTGTQFADKSHLLAAWKNLINKLMKMIANFINVGLDPALPLHE